MAREGLPGPSRRNFSSSSFSNSSSSDSSQSRSPFCTRGRRRRGSYSRRSRRPSPYNDSSKGKSYKRKRNRSRSVEEDGNPRSGDWDMNHNARERCCQEDRIDRISKLPDSIILHILSFLPAKDAVKSGVLSKRWAYLWTGVPCLSFSAVRPFSGDSFIQFVNATLLLHHHSNVEKFGIYFCPRPCQHSDVDRWIRLMTRAKVKELILHCQEEDDAWGFYEVEDELYALPQHLYMNSSLTKLELSVCRVKPVRGISWDSLKSLSLGSMQLDDGIMRDIIEGCPLLEFLELYCFYGINRLNLTNRSLRKLVMSDHCDSPYENSPTSNSTLEILAPYLQSLAMSGEMLSDGYRVLNAQYLVEYCCLNSYFKQRNPYILRELLYDLRHAKAVTLDARFIQVLSEMELREVSYPVSEHKCLKLDTCLEDWDLPGIAGLLKSSPCLENLIINLTNTRCWCPLLMFGFRDPIPTGENYWTSQTNFECLLLHLRTIKITGIVSTNSWKPVLQLIEFLVKNARVLEKITVHTQGADGKYFRKGYVSKELLEVAQKLLGFPRSSPRAVVTFME